MYSNESCFLSKIYFDCQLRNLLTVFFSSMSRDIVPAISILFSSRIYKAARFFTHSESESS